MSRADSDLTRRTATLALSALAACSSPNADPHRDTERAMDHHSHARPQAVRVTHLALDLTADFAQRTLAGSVDLALLRSDPRAPLIVDTQDLRIASVRGSDGGLRSFELGADDPELGTPLVITLVPTDRSVRIEYATSPDAAALQWLEPAQTRGTRPFLFTQGQAILTRSWIPLQDTPGVRATWAATIRTPDATDLTAVMSAEARAVDAPGVTRFSMGKPVPSYLIALAIGTLERREISPRCAVWAEPAVIEAAATELADTERMIATCERQFGPYRWGRYDVLVLPPSFPFGGMENPCMTFATPTILAGDRSLVALIAHELAHSWSGNLVTNATWSDFWLNEGFTVYLEQRIMEAVYGAERARMETALAMQKLAAELRTLAPRDQVLHIDLRGRNPDDGMTGVPYDKGAAFLRRLEELFGRERFDRFLQGWFDAHAFESVTTARFVAWLERELLAQDPAAAARIDVGAWLRQPGLPADVPRVQSAAFERVDAARRAWLDGAAATSLDTAGWSTMQWLHFLEGMPAVTPAQRGELDAAFAFTDSGNSEILAGWLELNLKQGYATLDPRIDARLERFLLEVGRRKFLKPLYEALAKTPAGLRRARDIYAIARKRYHAVATRTLDALLEQKR